jgi:CheY-like chemotaxis protein
MKGGGGLDAADEKRILVVEDDVTIARLIERAFVRLGYTVRVANSCAEARRAAGAAFQCGVFDIELRDGDGVGVALTLLEDERVRTVVFYTGSLDPEARGRAARVGRVIDKLSPFSDLENHVAELVASPARSRNTPKHRKP